MALKVIPGETRDDLLRIAIDLPESREVFIKFIHFTILFQVNVE